jgi:hypothetical protein
MKFVSAISWQKQTASNEECKMINMSTDIISYSPFDSNKASEKKS